MKPGKNHHEQDTERRFCSLGHSRQMRIDGVSDLAALLGLDEALWAATSAPAAAFRVDPAFLKHLDSDGSGRIDTGELKTAIRGMFAALANRSGIEREADAIVLSDLSDRDPYGVQVRESAAYLLAALNLSPSAAISLSRVRDFIGAYRARPLNGDGVICPESTEDADLAEYIREAVRHTGGTADVGGGTGVNSVLLDAFQEAVARQRAWRRSQPEAAENSEIMLFGRETLELEKRVSEGAAEVERYFALGRAVRFGLGGGDSGSGLEVSRSALLRWDSETLREGLKALPIALPDAAGNLPLRPDAVNPLFRDWIGMLRERIVPRVLGGERDELDEAGWKRVQAAFQPYRDYRAGEQGTMVADMEPERLERYADGRFAERARERLAADAGVGRMLDGMREVEKLLLYQAHMLRFCNNFVNFSQLYSSRRRALFEHGSAVIDGRWFNLALAVDDPAAHAATAARGGIFTLYFEIAHAKRGKRVVALPAVAGGKGNLGTGKRGVFFDLDGNEWDGQVIRIVENPISFQEALWAPFVRMGRFVMGKIEGWSARSEKNLLGGVDALTEGRAATAPPNPAATPAGMFLGVSLSFAAVGSSLALIARTLGTMHPGRLLGGLTGLIVLMLVPMSLVAFIKLWRQDLSDLLEAGGWSINARMRLTRAQRRHFTYRPKIRRPAASPMSARRGFVIALAAALLGWLLYRGLG